MRFLVIRGRLSSVIRYPSFTFRTGVFPPTKQKFDLAVLPTNATKVFLELGAMLGDSNAGSCVVMVFGNSGVACRQPLALAQGLKEGSIFEDARLFVAVKSLQAKYRWFWLKCRISRWLS